MKIGSVGELVMKMKNKVFSEDDFKKAVKSGSTIDVLKDIDTALDEQRPSSAASFLLCSAAIIAISEYVILCMDSDKEEAKMMRNILLKYSKIFELDKAKLMSETYEIFHTEKCVCGECRKERLIQSHEIITDFHSKAALLALDNTVSEETKDMFIYMFNRVYPITEDYLKLLSTSPEDLEEDLKDVQSTS
jgi:hypothetical protein